MKMRVVITPDGQVSVFSDDGTFGEGKEKIEMIMAALQAQGIKFDEVGQVEQHRHDHNGQHVHNHTHTGHTH